MTAAVIQFNDSPIRSIENELAKNLDYKDIMEVFAGVKSQET